MGGTCRGKVARGSARRFCKQSRGREGDAIRAFGSRGAAGRGEQAGPRIPSLVAPGQSAPPRGASVSPHSGQGVEGPPCASYSLDRGCRKPRARQPRGPGRDAHAALHRGPPHPRPTPHPSPQGHPLAHAPCAAPAAHTPATRTVWRARTRVRSLRRAASASRPAAATPRFPGPFALPCVSCSGSDSSEGPAFARHLGDPLSPPQQRRRDAAQAGRGQQRLGPLPCLLPLRRAPRSIRE